MQLKFHHLSSKIEMKSQKWIDEWVGTGGLACPLSCFLFLSFFWCSFAKIWSFCLHVSQDALITSPYLNHPYSLWSHSLCHSSSLFPLIPPSLSLPVLWKIVVIVLKYCPKHVFKRAYRLIENWLSLSFLSRFESLKDMWSIILESRDNEYSSFRLHFRITNLIPRVRYFHVLRLFWKFGI